MRSYSRTCALFPLSLREPQRFYRREYSPDRNYNQQIQDRQNKFKWSAAHTYRPHQHFTYDPSNWSRKLDEKVKQKNQLSITERLKMLDDLKKDNLSSVPKNSNSVVSQEIVTEIGGEDKESLQSLLDKMSLLSKEVQMPRFQANVSFRQRKNRVKKLSSLLVTVYERLEAAVVTENITLDALIFTWFTVFANLELLLTTLVEADPQHDESAAIHKVSQALRTTIITPLLSGQIVTLLTEDASSLEEVVELVYLLLHPFTRRSLSFFLSEAQVVHFDQNVAKIVHFVNEHASLRFQEPSGSESVMNEKLDPAHTLALAETSARLHGRHLTPVNFYYCCLFAKVSSDYVQAELQAVVSPKGVERSLYLNSSQGPQQASGVSLDPSDAPTGIREAPTKSDDVWCLTKCGAALFHSAAKKDDHLGKSEAVMLEKTGHTILHTLSLSPNYDLQPNDVVRFAVALQKDELGFLSNDATAGERSLRLLLVLSRLTLETVEDRMSLCELFARLCVLEPSASLQADTKQHHEWRRLRGLIMRQLFDTLTVQELAAYDNAPSWPVLLAKGAYDGAVPLEFWYECCAFYLPSVAAGNKSCPSDVAEALVRIRARMGQDRNEKRNALPLNERTISSVADCLVAWSERKLHRADLLQHADAWAVAVMTLGIEDAQVLSLLSDISTYLHQRQRQASTLNIINF